MSEEIGEYEVHLRIKGRRSSAHFLVKSIEDTCDLAEKYLDLKIEKKVALKA